MDKYTFTRTDDEDRGDILCDGRFVAALTWGTGASAGWYLVVAGEYRFLADLEVEPDEALQLAYATLVQS